MTHTPGTDNQALYELRDELKDLNQNIKKSNDSGRKVENVLLILTVVQIATGINQFMLSATTTTNRWYGVVWMVVMLVSILWIVRVFNKKI